MIVNFLKSNKIWIISNLNSIIEIKKSELYLKYCNNFNTNIIKQYKNKNPKISIISPIYNRKLYLLKFLKGIQSQNFQDLEIILVDDCSVDGSLEIINIFSKKDKRIIIIKNKIRKGTFLTRNIGVLYSKGKYIIIPDPDDLIGKNVLSICYKYAEAYKYDIIRFNIYEGHGMIKDNELSNENHCLKQPSLSTSIFYVNNELGKKKTDYNIYNKFIKKEIYIMSLNSLIIKLCSL
jgi:glycosyltransferase involved in cell wall biosynthesis